MLSDKITNAVNGVTKTWAKQKKAEERRRNAVWNRQYTMCRSLRITLKDAAFQVMSEAYDKASGNGTYPANARQIMYAARGDILEMTGEQSFKSNYFTQVLLPEYVRDNPGETADWDVAYDARGHFHEPHTNKEVPLGTLEVREYLMDVEEGASDASEYHIKTESSNLYPTIGPENRYSAILFIEKEGFMPLFRKAKIAERFDIGIMSSKGQSVVACRKLADEICGQHDIPLLLLKDFDVAGFSIANALRSDTDRYEYQNDIKIIDLGLRLEDVEEYGLESERVKVASSSKWNLVKHGATKEEIEFLCNGRRVELNAFTSTDFVAFIEAKLRKHKIGKLIPKRDTLRDAYLRAVRLNYVEDHIQPLIEEANEVANETKVPRNIKTLVEEELEECDGKISWDRAIDLICMRKSRLNRES